MQIYRESIQEFRLKKYTVRVGREVKDGDSITPLHDGDVSTPLAGLPEGGVMDIESVALSLLELECVNAVEMKDQAGNGCVLYRAEQAYEAGGRLIQVI